MHLDTAVPAAIYAVSVSVFFDEPVMYACGLVRGLAEHCSVPCVFVLFEYRVKHSEFFPRYVDIVKSVRNIHGIKLRSGFYNVVHKAYEFLVKRAAYKVFFVLPVVDNSAVYSDNVRVRLHG